MIAISGGIDSVVLSHLLNRLAFNITLVHCNFRLRGKASDEDQLFVKELASKLNIPFFTIDFETIEYAKEKGYSIQMAARELRYDWFEKIRKENKLDYIVTAHHLDDNLETFLINFTRGTGLSGLTGIPAINKNVVRPLLGFTRDEIEQFAKRHAISWREDQSNAENTYMRNKIRHEVLPILKELNPQLLASFKNTTEYLNNSQDIINYTLESIKKTLILPAKTGIQKIDIDKLKEFKNSKAYIFELLKDYNFTEWNDVADLLDAQSGKKIQSSTHRLIKDRNHLLLEPLKLQDETSCFLIHQDQDIVNLEGLTLRFTENDASKDQDNPNTIRVDAEKLVFPLTLRKRKAGDYFYPFGMTGKKKISKFFKDEKLSLIEKEHAWLLCSKNDIIWVVGRRLDDRYKVTDGTKKTIRIEYVEN